MYFIYTIESICYSLEYWKETVIRLKLYIDYLKKKDFILINKNMLSTINLEKMEKKRKNLNLTKLSWGKIVSSSYLCNRFHTSFYTQILINVFKFPISRVIILSNRLIESTLNSCIKSHLVVHRICKHFLLDI